MAKHRVFILFSLFWLTLGVSLINAQGHRISGRIVDAETLDPLPYAHVFIDQTTLGAVSDINGEYVIEDLKDGAYKLVFSYVGYEMFYHTVVVSGADVRLSARLVPQLEMLQSIEVKGTKDKEWEAKLKQFNRVFFGDTEWARECKILNPWVLDFAYDAATRKFIATATEPLQIQNKALGYTIICNLQAFLYDKQSYKIKGLYKFEEINTTDARQAQRWTRNRKQAYQSSLRFLMKSIIESHERESGFDIYLDKRPLKYVSQTGYFASELEKNLEPLTAKNLLTPSGNGMYKLALDKRIEVHHTTQFARQKIYKDVAYPISWIEAENGYIIIADDGHIQNSDQIITSGELNDLRIAGMLPLNYTPGSFVVVNYLTKRNQAKRLQERVYLQTDKATYYAGEDIWFKVHVNYANTTLRDSLSQVVYVEAVKEDDSVVVKTMLKIDTLGAVGVLRVPASWQPGIYLLRAYTQWLRNYGADALSYTPIRILSSYQKFAAKPDLLFQNTGDFTFVPLVDGSDSMSYVIRVDSSRSQEWISCGVSVAPYSQGAWNSSTNFKNSLSFYEDLPGSTLGDFIFPLEYTFGLRGKAIHKKRKNVQASITVFQGKMDSLYTFKTDRSGNFYIAGLNFYDTMSFTFQASDRKGRPFKLVQILVDELPLFRKGLKVMFSKFDTVSFEKPIMLTKHQVDTVPKTPELHNGNTVVKGVYMADFVLEEEELNKLPRGQSIISVLQGRIPGLQYIASTRTLSFRASKDEPLIVLDGMPLYPESSSNNRQPQNPPNREQQTEVTLESSRQQLQDSYPVRINKEVGNLTMQQDPSLSVTTVTDMISYLKVESIRRVEVNSRMDPRYGSTGANGVIYLYTKKELPQVKENLNVSRYLVQGYQKERSFKISNDYNNTGSYQPTVYWNPRAMIYPNQPLVIRFPGRITNEVYVISIGGVTKNGVPVYGEFLFDPRQNKSVNAHEVSLDQRQN